MPIVPTSAFVSVESVSLLIRAVTNDMVYSQAGELLTDTSNYLFPLINDSLDWFQNNVNNHGVESFVKETILTPVTVAVFTPANDPGQQVNISDSGYFDGAVTHAAPQVPVDLLEPQRLWERQTGSIENWVDMNECPGGLPSTTPSSRFRMWEWRQDGIYMPGATQSNDLRLRYTGSHATLVTVNDTLLFRGAVGAIAYKTVGTWLASKNPQASGLALVEAKDRMNLICTRSSRAKQREAISRRGYGNPRRGTSFVPPHN